MKFLVYCDLQQAYLDDLIRQLPQDADVVVNSQMSDLELGAELETTDILIGNPPASVMEGAGKNIRFWQLENVGFEQYRQMTFDGIVANVGDMSAAACAETIVAGILGFYRGVHLMVRNQQVQSWVGETVEKQLTLLGEKQVIILGSGAIAEQVRKFLGAFGCRVQMTAKSDPDADIHSYQKLLRALPQIDLVVNTLPGNLDNYVGKEFFQSMKDGALYANIGRGNTTDEAALVDALESGKLMGAVLDVTRNEPLPSNRKLWKMDNVILTQHTGAAHQNRDRDKVTRFLANINAFLQGKKVEDQVRLSDGY